MRSHLAAALIVVVSCQTATPSVTGSPAPPGTDAIRSIAVATATVVAWRRLADIPTPRSEVAAAAAAGRIYIIGGFGGGTIVERYDPGTDRWDRGPSLPIAVDHAMAASVGARTVYVFGGYANGRATARSFRLQLGADRWEEIAPMPAPRAAAAAVARGDKVYLVGGADGDRLVAPTWIYETAADAWRTGAAIPTPRDHLAGADLDAKVCAVGGRRLSLTSNLPTLECYDTGGDTWEKLADAPTPRGGVGAAVIGETRLVFVGGEQPQGTFQEVEIFDARTRSWSRGPDLPAPRHGVGVAAIGATVYVMTGGPRPGGSQTVICEALDLR